MSVRSGERQDKTSDAINNSVDQISDGIERGRSLIDNAKNASPRLDQPDANDISKNNLAQMQGQNAAQNTLQGAATEAGANAAATAGAEAAAGAEAIAGTTAAASSGASAGASVGTAVAPGVGTAAGAAVGALIKPLTKLLVGVLLFLFLLFFLVIVVFPQIFFTSVLEGIADAIDNTGDRITLFLNGDDDWREYPATPEGLLDAVMSETKEKHTDIMLDIDQLIKDKGWDVNLTRKYLYDTSSDGKGRFDAAYIVSIYSYATPSDEQTTLDLSRDLLEIEFYDYNYTEMTATVMKPVTIPTYKPQMIFYLTEEGAPVIAKVYVRDIDEIISLEGQVRPEFTEKTITDYSTGEPVTTTYYWPTGKNYTVELKEDEETFAQIVIEQTYVESMEDFYDVDLDDVVGKSLLGKEITAANQCTTHAKNLLYAAGYDAELEMLNSAAFTFYGYQSQKPLTAEEAKTILDNLTATQNQKYIINIALSGVGRIPYYWGGRSPAGWDNDWGKPRENSSNPSGVPDIYNGLDCSGFVQWTYNTAYYETPTPNPLANGSTHQMIYTYISPLNPNFILVDKNELQPGDVGVYAGHTAIFLKYDENNRPVYIHEAGGKKGCEISGNKDFSYYIRYLPNQENHLPWTYDPGFGRTTAASVADLAQYDYAAIGMDASTFEFVSQVLTAESKNSDQDRYYIAQTMKNRIASPYYPGTIMDVLLQPQAYPCVVYNADLGSTSVYNAKGEAVVATDSARRMVMHVFSNGTLFPEAIVPITGDKEILPADVTYYSRWAYIEKAGYINYKEFDGLFLSAYTP